jgi:hypothetical protein
MGYTMEQTRIESLKKSLNQGYWKLWKSTADRLDKRKDEWKKL